MRKKIIEFPEGGKILVQVINYALMQAGETGIRGATRKLTPQQTQQTKQVIVRSDGSTITNRVAKQEEFGINVYIKNDDRNAGYAEANRLTLLLEALLPATPESVSMEVKNIDITNIIAIEVDGEEQQRYITITATLKGKTKTI